MQEEEKEIPTLESPAVEEKPLEKNEESGGLKSASEDEVAAFIRNGGNPIKKAKDEPFTTEEVNGGENPVTPVTPVVPLPVSPVEDFIKIPRNALNGIFNAEVGTDEIITRLQKKGESLSDEDNKALEQGRRLLGRPDMVGLIDYALRPNANVSHYVDLMKTDVTQLSDVDAIVKLGELEGKDPAKLRSKLRGDFMEFGDEDYPEFSEERLDSMRAAAEMIKQEQGSAAKEKIRQLQEAAKRPPEAEDQAKQNQRTVNEQYAQAKKTSEDAWKGRIPEVVTGNKIESTLKFKGTDDVDIDLPFTFDLTKPERQSEIQKFTEDYLSTILTYDPNYTPSEATIKEAREAAKNRYLVAHISEIFTQIAQDVNADLDIRWAKKTNRPHQSQYVAGNEERTTQSGMVAASDQEVADFLNK